MEKAIKPTGKILFREEQQFRQAWLWILLISSTLVAVGATVLALPADKNLSAMGKLFLISIAAGIPLINLAAFYFTRLETVVTDEGLFYRWRPYFGKYSVIRWNAVKEVSAKKYPYLKYGYHRRSGFGKVHNVDGNKGIQLVLNNHKMIYFGSQRIDALQHTIAQLMPLNGQHQYVFIS